MLLPISASVTAPPRGLQGTSKGNDGGGGNVWKGGAMKDEIKKNGLNVWFLSGETAPINISQR